MDRRGFLLGFGAAVAAPAIVRVASIMPVRAITNAPLMIGDLPRVDLNTLRDDMLLGLHHFVKTYQRIPPQWDDVFRFAPHSSPPVTFVFTVSAIVSASLSPRR